DADNFHFLNLLVEHVRGSEERLESVTLEAAFERLHAALSPAAGALLELVCLSQHALPSELSFAFSDAGMHELSDLEAQRLVRYARDGEHESIVPYHPRVRAWLIGRTSPERRRACHQRLLSLDSAPL